MGRGADYQGLWVSKNSPPSNIRIQDTFLSLLRKHLISTWLSLKLDQLDRIISFKSVYYGKVQYFQFFWSGNHSYFLQFFYDHDKSHWILHKSWDSQNKVSHELELPEEELFHCFDAVGRKNLPDKSILNTVNIESILGLQIEKYSNSFKENSISNISNKKYDKKIKNIQSDLQKLSAFNELKNYLEKNLDSIPDVISFGDLKIKFPITTTLEQRRNLAFIKLKNWRKNYTFMQERLNKELDKKPNITEKPPQKIIKPFWKSSNVQATLLMNSSNTSKNNAKFDNCVFSTLSEFNVVIAIGKNSLANDILRNSWSKKTDYWFHLVDMTSAHLYLRPLGQLVLSQELFNTIGSLLLKESKVMLASASLIYCTAKDLKAVKGKPGSVRYKNEKKVSFVSTL